jgi:hypothetical protein
MKQMCRVLSSSARDGRLASRVLVHVRIVTDPAKLAQLRRDAAKQRRRTESGSRSKIEQNLLRGDF